MAEFGWAYIAGGAITGAVGPTGSLLIKAGGKQISGSAKLTFNTSSNTLVIEGDVSSSANVSASAFYGTAANLTGLNATNISTGTLNNARLPSTISVTRVSASTLISASAFHGNGANLTSLSTTLHQATANGNTTSNTITVGGFTATGNSVVTGSLTVSGSIYANELVTNVTSKNVTNISATGSTTFGDSADDKHIFTGQMGIGTATPSSTLEVAGSVTATAEYPDFILKSSGESRLIWEDLGGGGFGAIKMVPSDTAPMRFFTSGITASDEKMRITADGKVGIGTDSPSKTLDVAGDIKSTGAITGSKMNLTGLAAGTATTASFLAIDSSNNVVLTSSGGGSGGTIGAAEDGNYTDGLYTDFTTSTPVGTAVDRFNEVLKILAPSPAPNVKSINYDQSNGESAKLSFDASNPITNYTASSTNGGFSAVNRNGTYEAATSGANFKLGVYNAQELTGFVNYDVAPSVTNSQLAYASGAFGNANEGTLKLELNGASIHSVSLSGLAGSGNPATGSASSLTNGSGFTNVSITASSFDGNAAEWYIFKHRTAKYKIEADDQKKGWNYLRVVHTVGGVDRGSNYIEWINDPDGAAQALSISNPRIENITTGGSVYVSGVQYNTSISANYKADINNIYRNVFPTGTPISFSTTRSTVPSAQAVPNLTGGDDETKVLGVTASLSLTGFINPSQTFGTSMNVTHPLKSNISSGGSATVTGFLIYDNTPPTVNNLTEPFINETFRVTSASYDTQNAISGATWNSENHLTSSGAAGYSDGLIQLATAEYSGRLYSPISSDLPNNGNFSTLANGPAGNPNYSGQSGTRTYFRKIQNTSGGTKYNMKITSTKSGTTYNNSSLSTGNAHFFIKIPGDTGWMDISQNFAYGAVADGNGALISTAANDVDSGNNLHFITFGTASIAADDYVAIKVEADESWTGNLSELQFVFGASAETAASPQALSDIDANNTGTSAKLSFGSSNAIAGFTNVQGGGIGSMSTINSNGDYVASGDRRGVFTSKPTIDGEINDAIAGDGGSDYPAKAFSNAYSGSLILEVNGSEVHTINLASTLSGINTVNGNGSRLNVGALAFSKTSDGVPDYLKPYRTGTYEVAANDQNIGWNYARLIHRTNSDATTNYVEWVVDTSGAVDNTAISSPVLSDFSHNDVYYQSGIKYFASRPSASFSYFGSNFYSNVYSNAADAIAFSVGNSSVANIRATGTGITTFNSAVSEAPMPALNNADGCETTTLQVTGTILFNNLTSISGGLGLFTDHDVTVNSTLKHPFKTNKTTSTSTKTSFMRYSGSIGSTNLTTNEYFNTEDYRIVSGNYVSQSNATSSANAWNPQTHMNGANAHGDGMVTVNGFAISPLQIGKAGDTRNNAEGSTGIQAPAGNPNYSTAGLSDSIRTYYRYFRNTTGLAKATGFSVKLYGDAYLCAKGGSFYTGTLGANKNINVELKVPFDPSFTGLDDTSTAWGDVVRPYAGGVQPDTDGVGIYSGGNSDLNQTVDTNGRAVGIQLLEKQIRNNQYFVLKISAHKDWTGYLSRIEIVY